jgi:hypothetical protein
MSTSTFASRLPQWRPDPFGRYELRRFFFDLPTSLVMTGSFETYDAVEPLLIPDQGCPKLAAPLPEQTSGHSEPLDPDDRPTANQGTYETAGQRVPVAPPKLVTGSANELDMRRPRRAWRDSSDLHPALVEGIRKRLTAGSGWPEADAK